MASIRKLFIVLLATVSVALGTVVTTEVYAYNPNSGIEVGRITDYAEENWVILSDDFQIARSERDDDGYYEQEYWQIYDVRGYYGNNRLPSTIQFESDLDGYDYYFIFEAFISGKIQILDGPLIEFDKNDTIRISGTDTQYGIAIYINGNEKFRNNNYDGVIFNFTSEDNRPAIDGQENFVTSVEESKDIQYFIDFIKAVDDIDGDISHLIQIETDNYTPNKRVLGKHEVKIYVIDSSDNRSDFTFYVNVVDITKPVITGNSDVVQIGYKETYNIENFRKTLKVTDNYDSLTNADIELKTDGYTSNKGKLGTWNVVFEAKDKSDNSTTFTKPIKVYDNIAPVFSGTKEITKSYAKLMTLDDILKEVSVNDEIDGNITKITVDSDTFTGNGNKVGSYEIKLSAKDNAGNIGYWTITVKVIDDQGANWWITNGVTVNLTPGATLTRTQIVELLAKTGQVAANKEAVVTYDVDTYTENIGTPGLYTLGFTVKNLNGVSNSYTYGINVMDESNTDDENLDIEEDKSFIERNLTWIIASGLVVVSIGGYLFIKKRK